MKNTDRRTFLQKSLLGAAGLGLLPSTILAGSDLKNRMKQLSENKEGEVFWNFVKAHFPFQEGLRYFNNASLGPSPEYVIDATEKFRRLLDGFPSHYMWGGWNTDLEQLRQSLASLLGVDAEELALIHNTTEGMNVFARSFDLKAGDEVIVADHEHRVGTVPWQYFQEPRGVKIVRPVLPILPRSKDEIVQKYRESITPRTRIISMVHMTNTNGMILPVKEISEMAHEKGIRVCVDGAQSVGMFPFNLHELQCDFFTASSHKWLFAPKGTGFLYARKERIGDLKPLLLNRHFEKTDIRILEAYNTRNLPEVLGLGAALEYHQLIGPEVKSRRIYQLKRYFRQQLEQDSRFLIKTPEADDLSAGIQVVEIKNKAVSDVQESLMSKYRIDCRPMFSHDLNALRISLSVFITLEDVDYLLEALRVTASA